MHTVIKAKFKGMNTTADKAVLQFVVDESDEARLPDLLAYGKRTVWLDVDDGQANIFDVGEQVAPAGDVEEAEYEAVVAGELPAAVEA